MMRRMVLGIIIVMLMFNIVQAEENTDVIKAEVLDVKQIKQGSIVTKVVKLKILEGDYIGQEIVSEYIPIELSQNDYELKKGIKVLVRINKDMEGKVRANIIGISRVEYIKILSIIFLVCVVLFGGIKGILSVTSLGVTGIILIKIMIPLIIKGRNPIMVSILSSIVIILISFVLISGFTKKSFAAILGTIGGTIIAGILAKLFTDLCLITGLGSEEVNFLITYADMTIDFRGLYLSGVLIGVIGVVMDVSMSITSVVFELKHHNPKISMMRLLGSGLKVGKDIMATMVNTLILAYVGSAMPLLLVFHFLNMPVESLLNMEILVLEIIRSLCGSIGLILTIPLTSIIASLISESGRYKTQKIIESIY